MKIWLHIHIHLHRAELQQIMRAAAKEQIAALMLLEAIFYNKI